MNPHLPFSAVIGQEDAKLALILAALDRRLGGVLLRGDKGSAKTTLARGLAALLPGGAPFVELPVGATEDRLVGSLDLASALTGGGTRFSPGLLHAAHGGVLYVDEVNLLPDHLVDVLLDVAASGVNRVEREGVSHSHPSQFVLVGSMNPEEGELRPQLLDRFAFCVEVRAPLDPIERAAALKRRLEYDEGSGARWAASDADLSARLAKARPAALGDDLVSSVAALCASVGAEGLRADLCICRAAAALAGWEGRDATTAEDVRRVAPLALAHRARRNPFDPVGVDQQRLDEALDEALEPPPVGPEAGDGPSPAPQDAQGGNESAAGAGPEPATGPPPQDPQPTAEPDRVVVPLPPPVARQGASGRRGSSTGDRGRLIGDSAPDGPPTSVAVAATLRRAAARQTATAGTPPVVRPEDIRQAVRRERTASVVVVAVDASGSMGASQRVEAARRAVLGLLRDAYVNRDMVALVSFRDTGATVVLRPTGSVEVARARLSEIPTGGRTPLAAGLRTALGVATTAGRAGTHRPLLVVVTDSRATSAPDGEDPWTAAMAAAAEVRRAGVASVVVDVEGNDGTALGLGRQLAEAMGGEHVSVSAGDAQALEDAVRRAR